MLLGSLMIATLHPSISTMQSINLLLFLILHYHLVAINAKVPHIVSLPPCTIVYHQLWCAGANLKQVPVLPAQPHNATTYLDISRNTITSISWQLQLYPKLNYLNVANNTLSQMSSDAFRGLASLQEINLSNNKLITTSLSEELFRPLASLHSLNLASNLLGPKLNISVFHTLTSLTSLDLDYNNIMTLSGFHDYKYAFHNLSELKLRGNFLLYVPAHLWPLMPHLILLDLSENSISTVPARAFLGLDQLRGLFLNRISTLKVIKAMAFTDAMSLQDLQITNCKGLVVIERGAFGSINNLHLQNNALETLTEDTIPWQGMKQVLLYGNPWNCNCRLAWFSRPYVNKKITADELTICSSPDYVKGRPVKSLSNEEFKCVDVSPQLEQYSDSIEVGQLIAIIIPTSFVTAGIVLLIARFIIRFKPARHYVYGARIAYGPLQDV